MKCGNCDRPGLYNFDNGVKLCLDCHYKVQEMERWRSEAIFREQLVMMAESNYYDDQLDQVVGTQGQSYRFPVEKIAQAGINNSRMTNIHISHSQVGVLNTGDLAKIDAVVTITEGTDGEAIGRAIQNLTHAVLESKELDNEAKREIGELVAALTEQVAVKRSKPVAFELLKGIEERAQGVNGVVELVKNLGALFTALFGGQ